MVRVLPRSPDRIHPEPHTLAVEQFLEMLRFENRSKLAELPDELVKGYRDDFLRRMFSTLEPNRASCLKM